MTVGAGPNVLSFGRFQNAEGVCGGIGVKAELAMRAPAAFRPQREPGRGSSCP